MCSVIVCETLTNKKQCIATLFFINISLAANTAKVNVETANLREESNSESKILIQLSLNQEVEVVEKNGKYYLTLENYNTLHGIEIPELLARMIVIECDGGKKEIDMWENN